MVISFDAWAQSVNGQPIDNSPAYAPQCTDLWRDYLMRVIGAPWGAGNSGANAAELWTKFESDAEAVAWLTKVSPAETPRKGDGAIWSTALGGGTGHVGIVIADNGSSLDSWNQNVPPGTPYTIRTSVSKQHLLGYLRPKVNHPTPNPSDPTPTPEITQAGDNFMKFIQASNGTTYLVTANGWTAVANPQHLTVLRVFAEMKDGQIGQFAIADAELVATYLTKVDVPAIAKRIEAKVNTLS